MYKFLTGLVFFLFLVPHQLIAQISPSEGSALNYRIVGFSFPQGKPGSKYKIEIAAGTYNNDDSFRNHIIKTITGNKNKIIGEVPSFGSQYTWHIVTIGNAKGIGSELHHFSTATILDVDSSVIRMHILKSAQKYKDNYVFLDATRTLYNMSGQPVWYLPAEIIDTNSKRVRAMLKRSAWAAAAVLDDGTRDMKVSTFGTITFLDTNRVFEVNYNGDILWRGFDSSIKDSLAAIIGNYHHHQISRMANGHYMALGIEILPVELPSSANVRPMPNAVNAPIRRDSATNKLYQKIMTGRIMELDKNGKVVWSWNSSNYLLQSDLVNRKKKNGIYQLDNTHLNAFYFDEKSKIIYISFRNLNRILKIQYPSGKVLGVYGTLYTPGDLELNNDLFCGQHCVRRSMDGLIYLYNNNTCNFPCQLPTIIMMKETGSKKQPLKKVWEYECTLDTLSNEEEQQTEVKIRFPVGGSVFELPDRSIFCCMGGTYSKLFIVNRNKKILWSALPEGWDKREQKWRVLRSYRASIITPAELESLIWNEPLKNKRN